jgi:aspartate/tyrosine/aromatic aminotransferase
MFSYTGLPEATLHRLREEYSIYIVESGRINVAGLNEANLPRFARALADCL